MMKGLILALLLSQVRIPGPGGAIPAGGGAPTITVTSAACVANTATVTANCTLGASGAVGDLLIILSKNAATLSTATVAYSFSGTSSCTPTAVIAPGVNTFQFSGSGFITAMSGCIITTAGANIPVATWTGGSASFTSIQAFTVHTTNTWKTTFTDIATSSVNSTSTTSCPTGTTSATTTATDFIVAICDNFNVANTTTTLAGYTYFTAASRNTTPVFYKSVAATGAQSATLTLSTTDLSVGMIAAFASN